MCRFWCRELAWVCCLWIMGCTDAASTGDCRDDCAADDGMSDEPPVPDEGQDLEDVSMDASLDVALASPDADPACRSTSPVDLCDGIDEDCDGFVDEDVAREPCDTGTPGICGAGTRMCEDGVLRCRANMHALDAETCDGVDEDCDGTVDEQVIDLDAPCQNGIGECTREGVFVCAEGAWICSARPGVPEAERCDGQDDEDCDGVIDEGFHSGAPCLGLVRVGQAAWTVPGSCGCSEAGRAVCVDQQNITRTSFFVDRNNGLDDDCDGDVDEVPPEQ